jgi:hypothetical protein
VPTYLVERVIPPAFDIEDPTAVALHSRWAADAYRTAGIAWFGGVATDKGNMYSLVVADGVDDISRYCASLGIAKADFKISEVKASIGPHVAMARTDPRYRPPRTN